MSIAAMPRDPVYSPGHNATVATIAAYLCVQGGPTSIELAAGITAVPYGVTAQDIPVNERGNVQTGGWAVATAGAGGVTEGQRLMPEAGATGKLVPWTVGAGANASVIGTCMQTAAANKLFAVKLGAGAIGQGA